MHRKLSLCISLFLFSLFVLTVQDAKGTKGEPTPDSEDKKEKTTPSVRSEAAIEQTSDAGINAHTSLFWTLSKTSLGTFELRVPKSAGSGKSFLPCPLHPSFVNNSTISSHEIMRDDDQSPSAPYTTSMTNCPQNEDLSGLTTTELKHKLLEYHKELLSCYLALITQQRTEKSD